MTRSQKRRQCQQLGQTEGIATSTQLKKDKEVDPEVQKWLQQESPDRVKRMEGVLCRIWTPRDSPNNRLYY